jgi:hypothetical protein
MGHPRYPSCPLPVELLPVSQWEAPIDLLVRLLEVRRFIQTIQSPPRHDPRRGHGLMGEVEVGSYIIVGFGGFEFFGLPSMRYLNRAEHSAMGMRPATCAKR